MSEGADFEKEIADLRREKEEAVSQLDEARSKLDELTRLLESEKSNGESLAEEVKKLVGEKNEIESRRIEMVLSHREQTDALQAQYEAEKSELEKSLGKRIVELEEESDKLRRLSETVKVEFEGQLESLKSMTNLETEQLKAEKSELVEAMDLVSFENIYILNIQALNKF